MIKKLAVLGLVLLGAFTIVACKPKINVPEDEQVPSAPVVPDVPKEDEVKEPIKPTETFNEMFTLTRDNEYNLHFDVSDLDEISISILGESAYDIPVNFRNWKIDGEDVEMTGVTGTSYLVNHSFKIGNIDAVGSLINTHGEDLRLHTTHHTLTDKGVIRISVKNIKTLNFDIVVTTNAAAYITGLEFGIVTTK